ncbi:F0F1 ATP synthase subunit A [Candidatus Mycoplasma pogonae]
MLEKFIGNWAQPQLFTLVFITILISILAIVVYFKVVKVKAHEVPNTVALIAEQYVSVVDKIVQETGNGKTNKFAPYLFTLLTFLIFGNLVSLIGLEPVAVSYSIPLTLALITWIGIYFIGFLYNKIKWLMKFVKNPLEIVGVQALLLSLSFRIFGNIIGGSVLILLVNSFTGVIWQMIPLPIFNQINLLGAIATIPLRFYFDIFGTLIQCFIFFLLTSIFWGAEANESEGHEVVEKIKNHKLRKLFFKKTKN